MVLFVLSKRMSKVESKRFSSEAPKPTTSKTTVVGSSNKKERGGAWPVPDCQLSNREQDHGGINKERGRGLTSQIQPRARPR